MIPDRIRLDAAHRNGNFQNWRLGQALVSAQVAVPIGQTVWGTELEGPELVRSLQTSYHNNLFVAGDRCYFVVSDNDGISLHVACISDGSQDVHVERAVVIQAVKPHDRSTCLCPSLVPVGHSMGPRMSMQLLLLSTGYGDLHLIRTPAQDAAGGGTHSVEATCQQVPDGHAFDLQAAHQQSPGVFKLAAWRVGPAQASSSRRVLCEVVLMHAALGSGAQLLVQHTAVLQMGSRPPQRVLMDPDGLAVLVVASPEDLTLRPAASSTAHAGLGSAGALSGAEEAGLAAAAATAGTSAAGAAAGAGGVRIQELDDEDEDEMDQELLRQAAARLSAYTSAEQDGPGVQGPSQPWADVFREAGPAGEGELEDDPSVVLSCYLQPQQPPTPGKEGELPTPSWQLSMEPHRLLTACPAPGSSASSALLGLADDVDCAVVEVTGQATPQAAHRSSIPALAYVAAGKQQRRHLLLGAPGSGLAGVLVEQQRYCFVYQAVQEGTDVGVQQVVQLEGGGDERVVGAALLQRGGNHVLLVLGESRLHVLDVVV